MNLSVGIVGLPNVGKSTLFNAITKKSVPAENYPFCTIDPSVGVVAVPDDRLYKLATFSQTKKTVPAIVEFVDIAGLVKGASEGEGLGNQFLQHIREVSAIAHVVRMYEDNNLIHVHGKVDPLNDIEVINLELILADMQVVAKRLTSIDRDVKRGDKEAILAKEVLDKMIVHLESGKFASKADLTIEEADSVRSLQLITMKPMMYVLNRKSGGTNIEDERHAKLMEFFKAENAVFTIVDARIENDLKDFEGEEKEMFRKELGTDDDGINDLIKAGYKLLDVITYFTTGVEETRGWTIKKGWSAPMAGTAIHTDFKEKFIRAEVVFWSDLIESGSYGAAREKGLVKTEGKEYIVKDGDVMEFRV
ncbi:MAG: redox-regulated ATPase YchF [Patescibacteria group bacterium]